MLHSGSDVILLGDYRTYNGLLLEPKYNVRGVHSDDEWDAVIEGTAELGTALLRSLRPQQRPSWPPTEPWWPSGARPWLPDLHLACAHLEVRWECSYRVH